MTQGLRSCVVRRVGLVVFVALGAATIGVVAPPAGATVDPPAFETKWGTPGGPIRDPEGVAVDGSGNVYVVDSAADRVQKFTSAGVFVAKWGTSGSGDGQFEHPRGVAVDGSGNVYVTDAFSDRVQKFTSAGVFVTKWGTGGNGDGQFSFPWGVAVDGSGNVYVTDTGNDRVQKFTSAGAFITQWGTEGSGDGQFDNPQGVAVDGSGNVYVADRGNNLVQKFTSAGVFVTKWYTFAAGVAVDGSGNVYVTDSDRVQKFTSVGVFVTEWGAFGSGDGQFRWPGDLAVDGSGNVYVADTDNDRVQKFTSAGVFVTKWDSAESSGGEFRIGQPGAEADWPLVGDLAVDGSGNVYVADSGNNRVQKFTSAGVFVTMWGTRGSGDGQFDSLQGVAVDGSGNVYVADTGNERVQKFTSAGAFVTKWGTGGSGDGQFGSPRGVAVDGSGNVYVTDSYNGRVQKFTSAGVFVAKWGAYGSGDGQFIEPGGVAVDGSGNVYVTDSDRVQKFTSVGVFVTKWGAFGSGDGQFNVPGGVAVDGSGNVYVTDRHRVQKFTSAGVFVTKWGTSGSGDGEFYSPAGVAVDGSGNVYVADSNNARVQKFAVAVPPTGVSGTVSESGSGAPVAGAFVAVLRTSDFSIAGGGVADGSGDYTTEIPAGSYYLYVIDPAGTHTAGFFGAPTTVTVTAGATTDADPVMAPTRGSVTATVTDTGTGTPIGGVWGLALSASAANTGATEAAVTANGSGQLTLPGLRPGNHFVGYIDPTGAHGTRFFPNSPNLPASTPVAVTAGNATAANASLPAQTLVGTGSTITGTVTETGTNAPLANARVLALRAADYQIVRAAATNASGQYSLDLAAGAYKLAFLDATGLHDMEWYDDLPSTGLPSAVSVSAPGTANAALNANTGSMAGIITDDPAATPVAGAWVIAIGPTGISGGAVTAANGTYTLPGLAPGTYRATFVDPNGGRTQEYWDNSATYPGATTFNVTAANVATINAPLHHP